MAKSNNNNNNRRRLFKNKEQSNGKEHLKNDQWIILQAKKWQQPMGMCLSTFIIKGRKVWSCRVRWLLWLECHCLSRITTLNLISKVMTLQTGFWNAWSQKLHTPKIKFMPIEMSLWKVACLIWPWALSTREVQVSIAICEKQAFSRHETCQCPLHILLSLQNCTKQILSFTNCPICRILSA